MVVESAAQWRSTACGDQHTTPGTRRFLERKSDAGVAAQGYKNYDRRSSSWSSWSPNNKAGRRIRHGGAENDLLVRRERPKMDGKTVFSGNVYFSHEESQKTTCSVEEQPTKTSTTLQVLPNTPP